MVSIVFFCELLHIKLVEIRPEFLTKGLIKQTFTLFYYWPGMQLHSGFQGTAKMLMIPPPKSLHQEGSCLGLEEFESCDRNRAKVPPFQCPTMEAQRKNKNSVSLLCCLVSHPSVRFCCLCFVPTPLPIRPLLKGSPMKLNAASWMK